MKRSSLWICSVLFGTLQTGCRGQTYEEELQRIQSPDGHCVAILFHKERESLEGLPPETVKRWSRLQLIRDNRKVYDSGDEDLNIYQRGGGFALDLAWAPDSGHLAYRHIVSMRIISRDGVIVGKPFVPRDSAVTSFKWIDDSSLLVVSKKTRDPLDMFGKPYLFAGYKDKARDIHIMRLHLAEGVTDFFGGMTVPFALHPGKSFSTLRGLAECALGLNFKALAERYNGAHANDVWIALRTIVAEHLGLPPDIVTPTASFVNDLGCD